MKRLVAILALVLVGSAACSYGGTPLEPAAMTINGTSVPRAQLEDELRFLADTPDVAQLLVGPDVQRPDGSYDPSAAAALLSLHAQGILLADAVDDAGGSITDDDRAQAMAELDQIFGSVDPTTGQPIPGAGGGDVVASMPQALQDDLRDLLASQFALERAVEPVDEVLVTDEQVQEAFDDNKDQLVEVCVSHVLTAFTDDQDLLRDPSYAPSPEDEAAAEAAITEAGDRLEAGDDFATVAGELSDDEGSAAQGGELGCASPVQYVPEFAIAAIDQPVGAVGEPVRTQFGFHLILVTERTEPQLEDYEAEIRAQLEQQQAGDVDAVLVEVLDATVAVADVEIDPAFGTWSPDGGGVVPPAGASDPPGTEQAPPVIGLGR